MMLSMISSAIASFSSSTFGLTTFDSFLHSLGWATISLAFDAGTTEAGITDVGTTAGTTFSTILVGSFVGFAATGALTAAANENSSRSSDYL